MNGCDYITITGVDSIQRLRVTNCIGKYSHINAITTTSEMTDLIIRYVKIYDTYAGGIKIIANNSLLVEYCTIYQCFAKLCIIQSNQNTDIVVRGCQFIYTKEVDIDDPEYGNTDGIFFRLAKSILVENCYFFGMHRVHGDGIQYYRGPSEPYNGDITVRNCVFEDWRNSAIFLEETDGIAKIYNNVFYNNQRVGVENAGHDNVKIWNNTFVDHGDLRILGNVQGRAINITGDNLTGIDIRNNIIVCFRSAGEPDLITFKATNSVEDYNCLYDANEPNSNTCVWGNSYNNSVGDYFSAKGGPGNDINADPLFIKYVEEGPFSEQDFRLQEASPVRGKGVDLSDEFTTDINGNPRVNWDIGAYEYINTNIGDKGEPEQTVSSFLYLNPEAVSYTHLTLPTN